MKTLRNMLVKLILIGGLVISADSALADRWDNHGWRGNDRHDHYDRRGNDRGWNNHQWNNQRWNNGRRYDRDNTRWSVNLNLGSPGYWGPGAGLGWRSYLYGWRTFYNTPQVVVQPSRPVIIQNNTYVAPSAGPSAGGTSLFRDRYGRCYERSYNTLGTELRTELPASACNF